MANILEAANSGDVPRLKAILDAGGSVNQKDGVGETALHKATFNGHVTAMALLLDRGADLSVTNWDFRTALHHAALNGHVTAMALLLDRGADLSATDWYGKTALHWAAKKGHVTAMALLLDRGADVSAADKENFTARDLAVRRIKDDVVQEIDFFVCNMTDEWSRQRHPLYPLPFRNAVATVLALWGWSPTANAPWHPESPFPLLSLELLFEVFIWLGADIAERGYLVRFL